MNESSYALGLDALLDACEALVRPRAATPATRRGA
jgi:hypothetical protein